MAVLLAVQQLSKIFGVKHLFCDLTFSVDEGERIALIGPNGSGKSTLLRILAGVEDPDSGAVVGRSGLHIGYVPQTDTFPEGSTVERVIEAVLGADRADREGSLARALGRGGFSDRTQPVDTLSGGWRKRLAIVRELAREPELLLLDEPTNHLDIEGILWLEKLLQDLRCAVLLVSHDRTFIERVAQRVMEVDRRYPKGILSASGGYRRFQEVRAETFEQLQSYQAALANKVRREVEWLRRGPKARTTKSRSRINSAHELIEELQGIHLDTRQVGLDLQGSGRRSKELLKVEDASVTLGGKPVVRNLSLLLSPGKRVGIAGPNGSGKSTILKLLAGELLPERGTLWHAPQLEIALFDQHREQLDEEQTLYKALCKDGDSVVFNGRTLHVASWAERFLFSPAQLQLPVKSLSGGEKARVLIARLMLRPADVLLLDEPTNDLDISTLEVLEETLVEFAGAVVLVTHDRTLLDSVCTKVVGIMDDGSVEIFADYSQLDQSREAARLQQRKESQKPRPAEQKPTPRVPKKLTFAEERELSAMEEKISESENRLADLQRSIAEGSRDPEQLHTLCEELATLEPHIQSLYARWQELETKQEEFRQMAENKGRA